MYNTVEYSYEKENRHLKDSEALEKYKKALIDYPDALIILDDLDCGHWDVDIYKTEKEKETFYKKRISKLYKDLLSRFKK